MKDNTKIKGILLTLTGGILWGFSGNCGQFLFQHKGLTPNWLVPVRLLCSGIVMVLYLLLRDKERALKIWKEKRDAIDLLIFGILGMCACQYFYFAAIHASNAGTATVLQYLGPAMIMIYISLRQKKLPKRVELIAVFFALLGTFLLATHGTIQKLAISKEALFLGLISAVALAIYSVQPVRIISKWGAMLVTGWGLFIGGIFLTLLLQPWKLVGTWDVTTFVMMGVVIVFGTIIPFTCYLEGIRYIGPKKGSLYACVEPLSATLFAVIWLKNSFGPMDLLGMACILLTILLLSQKSGK